MYIMKVNKEQMNYSTMTFIDIFNNTLSLELNKFREIYWYYVAEKR